MREAEDLYIVADKNRFLHESAQLPGRTNPSEPKRFGTSTPKKVILRPMSIFRKPSHPRKIVWYVLLSTMIIFTILFFFDLKFVAMGLNIIEWDMLVGGIWIFVRSCRCALQKKSSGQMPCILALILVPLAAAFAAFGLFLYGKLPSYIEGTEPRTQRTFVVECHTNVFNEGSARLYERFGPILVAGDAEEYVGEFLQARPEERQLHLSEDGRSIVIAFFFLRPVFTVPA